MAKLKKCPCCQGEAEYSSINVDDSLMWQIYCGDCGLSTAFDEARKYCRSRWHLRLEIKRAHMWVTTLAALIPFTAIVCFSGGLLIGMAMAK